VTEPKLVMVKRYECPTCSYRRSAKKSVADHMARCWENPANKACRTCRHFQPSVFGPPIDGPSVEERCGRGLLFELSEITGNQKLHTDCELWEPNQDQESDQS